MSLARTVRGWVAATGWIVAIWCGTESMADETSNDRALSAEDRDFFENRIRPLLVKNCYSCHSAEAERVRGGLRLDTRAGVSRGGDSGPLVSAGRPAESLLIEAVRYENPDLQMPPRSRLSDAEIEALERWVEIGVPDPRTGGATRPDDHDPNEDAFDLEDRRDSHWSWAPLRSGPPPTVSDESWARDPLDRYVLRRLESEGLRPAPETDRRAWLRRVSFDLSGLGPSPGAVDRFLADDSPLAYERAVDRLLAAPAFGETWGVHWLDLMRYAETRGHEQDYGIPEAFRYRDAVVRAFNSDVPFDRWFVEHVAGDLVETPRVDPHLRTDDSLIATGFWHLGDATHSPVDIRGDEAERFANEIDVFSRAFLGLSVGCARCHDHKFDPITQRDYYALYGYLQSSSFRVANVADPEARESANEALSRVQREEGGALRREAATRLARRADRMADYLTAVGTLRRTDTPDAGRVAASHGLDPALLERWRSAVEAAAQDPNDPLHVVARIAGSTTDASDLARRASDVRRSWRDAEEKDRARSRELVTEQTVEKGERNYVTTQTPASEEDLVADYDTCPPDAWIVSGYRFGTAPAPAGSAVIGSTDVGIRRVLERGEATVEGSTDRFDGLLRTPTFEVRSNTLWYGFRGKADVFLAVDSHRVVAGPLHGVVKKKIESKDGRLGWAAHNVRDYIGHRVHVEFRALSDDFALEEVRFSKDAPFRAFRANARVTKVIDTIVATAQAETSAAARSGVELDAFVARTFAASFAQACTELGTGDLESLSDAGDGARLVNWLIDHSELFGSKGNDGDDAEARIRVESRLAEYRAARDRAIASIPDRVTALAMLDGDGENEPVHVRGNHRIRTPEAIPRRFLAAVSSESQPAPKSGSGRLELARRMLEPRNSLLRRVVVNRIWHHLFGRGIVPSVDDFGAMGEPPTHPELLDHLALRFEREGWSFKKLIRAIVLSSTYRMSSRPDGTASRVDPTNALLHRSRVRRVSAEAIRDQLFAVSGRLDRRMGGPSVRVHITPFMRGNRTPGGSGPADGDGRRSLYIEVRRNHLSHFLSAFDKPVPFTTIGRRGISNSPAQPLILLNDPLMHELSRSWAERLVTIEGSDADRLEAAYRAAFGRPPKPEEQTAALAFLRSGEAAGGDAEQDGDRVGSWADLCHTLFNVKEFIYLR